MKEMEMGLLLLEDEELIINRLKDLILPGDLLRWLDTRRMEWGGRRPIDMIRMGYTGPIWRMIYHLESGDPS